MQGQTGSGLALGSGAAALPLRHRSHTTARSVPVCLRAPHQHTYGGVRLSWQPRNRSVKASSRRGDVQVGNSSSPTAEGRKERVSGSVSTLEESNTLPQQAVVIRRSVKAGQVESHRCDVIVMGDVERGAAVESSGDVVVWGALRGEVHAGNLGDTGAVVSALHMEPEQLAIASAVAPCPDSQAAPNYPETAALTSEGSICIEPAGSFGQRRQPKLPTQKSAPEDRSVELVRVAAVTGIYILLAGLATIVAPYSIFGIFFPVSVSAGLISTGWVQVLGVIALVFGIYYTGTAIGSAKGFGVRSFYQSTVIGRLILSGIFGLLVATRAVEAGLLIIGAVNAVGAGFMFNALRRTAKAAV